MQFPSHDFDRLSKEATVAIWNFPMSKDIKVLALQSSIEIQYKFGSMTSCIYLVFELCEEKYAAFIQHASTTGMGLQCLVLVDVLSCSSNPLKSHTRTVPTLLLYYH